MAKTVNEIVDAISELKVTDLVDLVSEIEERFGVSAAAVAAPVAVAGDGGGAAEAEAEQTEFAVHLASFGEKKVNVIKVVRSLTGLGLKEAKELVDGAPSLVKEGVEKEEAESIKAQIEEAGGSVELK